VRPPFGRFTYDATTRKLTWSERTFRIHGFAPGDVVPSLGLMSSHVHVDDRQRWDDAVTAALADGTTFCEWLRLVDATKKVRTVLAVGYPGGTGHTTGAVGVLSGFVIDITVSLRADRERETTRAVLDAASTRDLIEQAKGMMMVIFDLRESEAFDLLRWHSSRSNIKLRDVAATLVERLVDPELAGTRPRERLTAILAGLTRSAGPGRPPLPEPVAMAQPAVPAARTGGTVPAGRRISAADLPRTMVRAVSVAAVSITIADWLDPDHPLVYVNDAFAQLTGYPSDDILGRNCRFLQGPESDQRAVRELRSALDSGRDVRTVLRNYRKDGTAFWNEVHLSAVRDDTGGITHYIGYQSDVSERVEREEQLRSLAYRHPGTDLPNAAAGLADLESAISTGRGRGFDVLCVLPGDADAADSGTALRSGADRLRRVLPADSCLSVQDDLSFLVRLPAGGPGTDEVVTAVRAALTEPEVVGGFPTGVRAGADLRIGRARFPDDGASAASLIAAAVGAAQHRSDRRPPAGGEPPPQEDA
jgi:PAS domain S-box-containing protein